jgi:acyl-CoA synthetase (AMP-forming)/AMP-acid ligase II
MQQDTLKVSGIQVSPVEIENVLLGNPKKYITDATVAGVSGHGRTSDEKVPYAWVVLSPRGREMGEKAVIKELESWHKKNLSKYKWLRGGIEIVDEVRLLHGTSDNIPLDAEGNLFAIDSEVTDREDDASRAAATVRNSPAD